MKDRAYIDSSVFTLSCVLIISIICFVRVPHFLSNGNAFWHKDYFVLKTTETHKKSSLLPTPTV